MTKSSFYLEGSEGAFGFNERHRKMGPERDSECQKRRPVHHIDEADDNKGPGHYPSLRMGLI